jgi:transcription elongation factor Elf1
LEEAIAMIKEDDSKRKHHGGSKSKKEKDVKDKDKEKDGLFGLFSGSHKKSMCLISLGARISTYYCKSCNSPNNKRTSFSPSSL